MHVNTVLPLNERAEVALKMRAMPFVAFWAEWSARPRDHQNEYLINKYSNRERERENTQTKHHESLYWNIRQA